MDRGIMSDDMLKPFVGAETVDISSANHTFTHAGVTNAIVTASGNVVVVFADDTTQTIPVVVAANDYSLLFKGGMSALIKSITKTGTNATVLCGLY